MVDTRAPQTTVAPRFRQGFCDPSSRKWILASAILASALGFIDGSIVSVAMPAMRASLGASLEQAQWISNAYMLTLSALILTGGALGDRFGVARTFSAGIVLFMAASLACAFAPSADTLIIARGAKGIGAAVMIPGSLALIARAYPRDERGRAIGVWAAASALTTAIGPVLGGIALSFGGDAIWRWLFAINLPLGALALWFLLAHVRSDPGRPEQGVDVLGAVFATVGLGALAFALTSPDAGPVPYGLGVGALGAFLWWESRTAHPMMPLSLFSNRSFAAANLATFTLYFALSAVLFFLPMTLIVGWGLEEVTATLAFVPMSVFVFLFSARAGKVAESFGAGRMIGIGSAMVAMAFMILAVTIYRQNFWGFTLPAMALMGLGMSIVVAPLSTVVMGSVPEDASGAASGINNAVSRVAGLIAVAAMGLLVATVYPLAGGTDSFGAPSDAPSHAKAMNTAFAALGSVTAALAALSALVAWIGIRPAQTGS